MYRAIFKPLVDFTSALFLLVILSPIIGLIILMLLFANRGDVFFIQKRPGLNARPFKIIKFKTMRNLTDHNGIPLSDELRLTKIGRIIRLTSLDELLQLINVLKGDMSIVGPRPLLMQYLDRYSSEQSRRHLVKPGITGWAQVNGRNAISWELKFMYDLYYVDHQSFYLDLKIVFRTILAVLSRRGISSRNSVTMEEFMGAKNVKEDFTR